MVRTANSVLLNLSMETGGRPVTQREIFRAFARSGYGKKRTAAWFRDLQEMDILVNHGEDTDGFQLYKIELWGQS